MKKQFISSLVLALGAVGVSAATKKSTIRVEGMHCKMCSASVEKALKNAKEDSLKALHLIGESVFEVYGVKSFDEMIGRTIRTPYTDYPDICSGSNFLLTGFASPEAAIEHSRRHNSA